MFGESSMLSVIWTGVSKKVFLLCLFHSQLLKHNARNFFIENKTVWSQKKD